MALKYPSLLDDAIEVDGQKACAACEGTEFKMRRGVAERNWITVGFVVGVIPGVIVWALTSRQYAQCKKCGLIYSSV